MQNPYMCIEKLTAWALKTTGMLDANPLYGHVSDHTYVYSLL